MRASQARERLLSREEMAEAWFTRSTSRSSKRCGGRAGGTGTETERYLRVAMLRYLLLATHEGTDEIIERCSGRRRRPTARTRWCT